MGGQAKKAGRGRRKPTSTSVTSTQCKCGALQRAAEEPSIPIVFDARLNEYHITNIGRDKRGYSNVYHCFFCGGAAPPSKRHTFFATITAAEVERLDKLTYDVKTVKAAFARFGKPEEDLDVGLRTHSKASDTEPTTITSYRTFTYKNLSKTADVVFTDYSSERGLRMTLRGKYLGEQP